MFIQMILSAQDNKWFQKGVEAKDPKEKIEYYTKSLNKEGKSSATYNNRGLAYTGVTANYQ